MKFDEKIGMFLLHRHDARSYFSKNQNKFNRKIENAIPAYIYIYV